MFPCYTPWKQQKTIRFSGVFRVYKMGSLARNGLNGSLSKILLVLVVNHEKRVKYSEQTHSEHSQRSKIELFFKNSWRPRVANYCDSSDSSNQGLHNTVCIVPQNFVLDV